MDLELPSSCIHLPNARIAGVWMLGRHANNWATLPGPQNKSILILSLPHLPLSPSIPWVSSSFFGIFFQGHFNWSDHAFPHYVWNVTLNIPPAAHIHMWDWSFTNLVWAREMAQWSKSNGCSSRRLKFNFQHPHDGSQSYVTPVPGESDAFFWPLWAPALHMVHRYTCGQNTHNRHKKIMRW